MSGERTYAGLRFWTIFLAWLSLLDLVILLVVVTVHAADPLNIEVVALYPLFYIFAGSACASLVMAVFWFFMRYPQHRKMLAILLLITTGLLAAHFYTINSPPTSSCYDDSVTPNVDGCAMDEIYYVPAAQALLTGEKCGPYIDNCNLEHPFLSKAFIAAGIVLFGNNDFGWRFFVVLLGTACIPVLFAICWKVTRDSTLSLFAAYLLAFETLFFVHSSMAVIDIQGIFFALLAFLVYLGDFHFWKFNRYIVSGFLLGIAFLCKETAVFLVIFLAVYNLLFGTGKTLSRFLTSIVIFGVALAVFAAGLQVYVSLFGNSSLHTFLDDIHYILSYGSSLKGVGWIDSAFGTPITPFNWMTYYSAIGYYVSTELVNNVPVYIAVGYWGTPNFFEIWLTYLWAPYVVYLAYKRWRWRPPVVTQTPVPAADLSSDDAPLMVEAQSEAEVLPETAPKPDPSLKLAGFALLWFALTYFPYFGIYYYGRVTYPFYILPAIPAICIGGAYILSRKWFPREVAYILLAGVFLWFFLYYPDKSFLPTWIRMLLYR